VRQVAFGLAWARKFGGAEVPAGTSRAVARRLGIGVPGPVGTRYALIGALHRPGQVAGFPQSHLVLHALIFAYIDIRISN
jgi:hypothetical protein